MRYYMFNKPTGCVTARRDERHRTVMDYFPECDRDVLFPVGRLDRDTVGFLLVTDDGQLCTRLMRPEGHIEKTYFFVAKGEITDDNVTRLEGGIDISVRKMAKTLPASLEIIERTTLGAVVAYLNDDNRKIALSRPDLPAFIGKLTITEGKMPLPQPHASLQSPIRRPSRRSTPHFPTGCRLPLSQSSSPAQKATLKHTAKVWTPSRTLTTETRCLLRRDVRTTASAAT